MRGLIAAAIVMLVVFFVWLLQPDHIGDLWLFVPIVAAFALTAISWLFEWWYYWRIDAPTPREPKRPYTVDVFTTACPGEPYGMIARTLEAMQKIKYPHTSYLCDEGDDPKLRALCERLGVVHVTRTKKINAKAGNINNALAQSSGEICIILDPDHEPAPYMIDRLVAYFDEPDVGFVQSIQPYRNQNASKIARGAAEMSYHFYGPIQMGMHGAGTPQAIGANCAFRREALESIGGHAAGLAEDMHTAMRLFSEGWRGLYVPEALTRGLVPQTLGAIYKQQLKWSCGVFDLLFQVYPKLARKLTWNQRLHFLLCPLFFMQGWITAAAIFIPLMCLLFGGEALKITMGEFAIYAAPLIVLVVLIRMMSQRYLAEPSERGLHLVGGALANGTWWVFNIGNLCALLRRKIPYLPTPKDDHLENAWLISVPNMLVVGLSIAAIPIGLERDYSPFNMVMAVFAGWNAVTLGYVVLLGQQRFLYGLKQIVKRMFPRRDAAKRLAGRTTGVASTTYLGLLTSLRQWPVAIAVFLLLATVTTTVITTREDDQSHAMAWSHLITEQKQNGGFYAGIYLPWELEELETLPDEVDAAGEKIGRQIDITSIYMMWGPQSIEHFPEAALQQTIARGGMPMITWEPFATAFPWVYESMPDLVRDENMLKWIAAGKFDYYIREFAQKLRGLNGPVFLRFAHEMDNPHYPWSQRGNNTPADFKASWRRVVDIFHQEGASNVSFIFSPWRGTAFEQYYPGDEYVDWVGLTLLNYGKASGDGEWYSFDEIYSEFTPYTKKLNKPVILAEFGSTRYGGNQARWLSDAFESIANYHPEIRSVVMFHSDRDKNWATDWRPSEDAVGIDWSALGHKKSTQAIREGYQKLGPALRRESLSKPATQLAHNKTALPKPTQLKGEPGSFELLVDGKPFYVKGVAYNAGHDWRDGGVVLTRRQLEQDFAAIKAMGANTIRRYAGGWADHNLFNVAEEHDLKILYGLWLDQDVDYLAETDKLAEIESRMLNYVRSAKDEDALLAWVVGNEAWGMLQHTYEQPYLTDVRHAYVRFVERLARKIREIDPDRPIMVALESSWHLPGALTDYTRLAPTVDAIGVNAYYDKHIAQLAGMVYQYAPGKPFLVTEFGPDGYWHSAHTKRTPVGTLAEPPAHEKAQMYASRWAKYIEPQKGNNLGGIAYCWSDRFEASATWFGITNMQGEPKPAYYALRDTWTGTKTEAGPRISRLNVSGYIARPGGAVRLASIVENVTQGDALKAEWRILDENFAEHDSGDFENPTKPTCVVKMPMQEGVCWVHLTVKNKEGRMDEWSVPIMVRGSAASDSFVESRSIEPQSLEALKARRFVERSLLKN